MTITRTVETRMEMNQWRRSRMGIIHADGTESGTIYSSVSLSITSIGIVWFPVNSYAGVIVDTQLKTVFHCFDVQVAF